jgi:GDP-L-fucose synthase
MYLKGKTVFLAGATGMAGSNIMKYLLQHYPDTRIRAAYYIHSRPFIQNKRIQYVCGDLRNLKDTRRMTKGCDCAIMAAANTAGAGVISKEPWQLVSDNVIMNTQMLEAFYLEKIKRVVYIGSTTLYQEFKGQIKEDQLDLNKPPHLSYLGIGNVMRFVENLCEFWHQRTGIEIIIIRATNIFGPFAKFNPKTSNFIPAIIRKAVNRMDPFEVWGSPDVTRDVIYAEDFARAAVMSMDNERIKCDCFNIGSGKETTVACVVKWALEYAGHKPKTIKYNSDRPTTAAYRAFNCTKAKRVLGWKPKYSPEEGIKMTTEWWTKNKGWWKR